MADPLDERAIEIAQYIIETGCTVRAAAGHFGVSKSTVHKDVTYRLRLIDKQLYNEAEKVIQYNKSQRHIRGGEATKRKYALRQNASPNKGFE